MLSIHLLYSNSRLPLSPLIRWRTKSRVSHSAILFTTGEVTDSSLVFQSTLSAGGTHFTTFGAFKKPASEWWLTSLAEKVTKEQYVHMLQVAESMDAKPYDLKGVLGLGIGVGRDWQENDRWWCSEAIGNIVKAGGMRVMDWTDVHTVTPKDNWLWSQTVLQYGRG